ncbi:MAG: sulfatase-modifying factor protein [Gemmataceae bacterium]
MRIVGLIAVTIGLAIVLSLDGGTGGAVSALTPEEMKPYVETIPGTKVRFEMVPIRGGVFLMGSPESEPGRQDDEGPQHLVQVGSFWMGKYEVTWNEYDVFAFSLDTGAGGREADKKEAALGADAVTRPTPPYTDMTFGYGHDGYPALCMTHHAAMEYCRWLSLKTGKTYRLPTEAEWEYACRAGTRTAYSFGDDPGHLGEYAWYLDNADGKPHPVGKKKPNPWGLYDMHGNVAEWCLDHYDKKFYARFDPKMAVPGPVLLPTDRRFPHVVRGGSWDDEAVACRSAARRPSTREWLRQDPNRPQSIWWLTEATFVGFRIVRPLVEQDNLKNLRSQVTKDSKYNYP